MHHGLTPTPTPVKWLAEATTGISGCLPREETMAIAKSTKVPKAWGAYFAAITAITDRVCTEHLNDEYAELARQAIAALCRKRPSPLARGSVQVWACAVVYALGQVNFLSDRSGEPHMAMAELCAVFDVSGSTGANKARVVRDALKMGQFDLTWTLPSQVANNPMAWLVEVDGLVVDARHLPRGLQELAHERGLIPYVPCETGE